jgi:hypothetical protein
MQAVKAKKAGKKGIYSFYFYFDGNNVTEKRDDMVDYSKYYENWRSIENAFNT